MFVYINSHARHSFLFVGWVGCSLFCAHSLCNSITDALSVSKQEYNGQTCKKYTENNINQLIVLYFRTVLNSEWERN